MLSGDAPPVHTEKRIPIPPIVAARPTKHKSLEASSTKKRYKTGARPIASAKATAIAVTVPAGPKRAGAADVPRERLSRKQDADEGRRDHGKRGAQDYAQDH